MGGFSLAKTDTVFAGDTGYGSHFKQIHERYGDARGIEHQSVLYEPRLLMRYVLSGTLKMLFMLI